MSSIVITNSRIELEYKKLGKMKNYNSAEEIFMTQSILLKWNEMKFLSPWKLQDLSLSLPFDPFSPLQWRFRLESSSNVFDFIARNDCLFVSDPRIIYFNFLQMKADAFSQRQQFPYFINFLLKLGQSCERNLDSTKEMRIKLTWW